MNVRLLTVLDSTEFFVKFHAPWAGLSICGVDIFLAVVKVIDFSYGRYDGGSATSSHLVKSLQFVYRDVSAFHSHAEVFGKLGYALVGD